MSDLNTSTLSMALIGSVAIVGRPNVGKSTLLNDLVGEKLSITSNKPQTTRHRIRGICTENWQDESGQEKVCQVVYLDTPGFHRHTPHQLNRALNKTVISVLHEADIILFLVDCQRWTDEDERLLLRLKDRKQPVILGLNKIDTLDDLSSLYPKLEEWSKKMPFLAVVPFSARTGKNLAALKKVIYSHLQPGQLLFGADEISDINDNFMITELIREKLMRCLGEEVPYATTVQVEKIEESPTLIKIAALIWVEKDSQKAIVIGHKGEKLKQVGQLARQDMENWFEKKVFLHLWVKVKSGWSDDEHLIRQLGYGPS